MLGPIMRVGIRPIVVPLFAIAVALASGGASYAGAPVEPESKLDTRLRMILAQTHESGSARASAGLTALGLSIAVYDGDQPVGSSDGAGIALASEEPLRFGVLVRVTDQPERVADTGAGVGGIIGNIVSARATMDEVLAIAALPNVTWVESSRKMDSASVDVPPAPASGTGQPALDESIPFIGAGDIWNDLGVTGEGVVVAVIDSGIWPEHPSFQDDLGESAFTGGWDQTDPAGPPPDGFGYGTQWSHDDFSNGATNMTDPTGHGTAVTSVVAGREVDGLAGVAPGAGIYAIKSTGFSSDLVDAIDRAVADGVDVINYSIGGHDGAHDGTSGLEEALTSVFNDGVFVATSAGNAGNKTIHANAPVNPGDRTNVGFNLAQDPVLQDFGPGQFNFYYDPAINQLCTGVTTPNGLNVGPVCPGDSVFIDTLDGCAFVGNFGPNPANGLNEVSFDIIGPGAPFACPFDAAAGDWQLYFDGSDVGLPTEVEGWSLNGMPFGAPFGNTNSTVQIPGTARDIVTVGAFTTRTSFLAQDGQTYFADPPVLDALAAFSSRGPTAGGIVKPDITAPGVQILAANSPLAGLGPDHFPASHPDELFQAISGTSMSAPRTAGAAALIKQLHPDWTPGEIKSALMLTAAPNPDFGPTPNNFVGAGNLSLSTFPLNDDFERAQAISDETLLFLQTSYLSLATLQVGGPPPVCGLEHGADVWHAYSFNEAGPGDTRMLRADTSGTDFPTTIEVFTGDPFGEHEVVGCGASFADPNVMEARMFFQANFSPGLYHIRVSGSPNGTNGSAAPAGSGGDGLLHFRLSLVEAQDRIWGDANCSGSADPIDSLLTLRFDAGLSTDTGGCPELGQIVDVVDASQHVWGDVDCGGDVTPIDSLKLLRFDAGLGASQEAGCPLLGSDVLVVE